jgi:outer membrane receptor protein involved in Fe transport
LSTAASALPAASSTLDEKYVTRTPIASYGDVFRALPGFNVANYGQGAIGYGLSMRGYTDAEHGRDIAYYIDGVPLNDVSSIHTPNYADLNILIPETVKSIEVIRGPFSVECGDSNLGGCINITTKRSEPFASLGVSGGSFGTVRGLGTYSRVGGAFEPFMVLEGYHTDGYRDNSFVDRYNSFNKVTLAMPDGSALSLRMQAYGTQFGAPSYISRDLVAAGLLSLKTAINSTDGGNKELQNFVSNYVSGPPDHELSATLFVNHDIFNRYADFGTARGQRWQQDERETVGGKVRKVWTGAVGDMPAQLLVGGSWRSDFIDAFQGLTNNRVLTTPQLNVGVNETNLAGFSQIQVKPLSWVKLTGGARLDYLTYDVTNRFDPTNQPSPDFTILSPKVGIAVTPVSWLELYANYGEGFRSPDAASPDELLGNPTMRPFKIVSKEVGAQFRFGAFNFLADVWTTDSSNEIFQPAPGADSTLLGRARRDGFDLDARFYIRRDASGMIALFANYGGVRARLLDSAPSFFVPNVPEYVANVGVEFDVPTWNAQRVSGQAFVTFVGKKNLSQDGLLTTSAFSRLTGRVAYSWPDGWTAFTQATWYPGDRLSEFAINFGDVTNAASSVIRTSPVAEFTVMAGLSYRFATTTAMPLPTAKMVVK